MDACVHHPEHEAIERCEVCGQPLCGLCLWYGESGHRLCAAHAEERRVAGERVLPPQTYHEAIESSIVRKPAVSGGSEDVYRGNNTDLSGLLAALLALTTLVSCMGGVYCLPLVAFLLGAVAYSQAGAASDPKRTRRLAGLGLAVSGLMLLALVTLVVSYVLVFVVAIAMAGRVP